MNALLIFTGLLLSVFSGKDRDQVSREDFLTAHSWGIKTHTMTGIGIHHSIPKGTRIEFLKDKTWKSSAPIDDVKTGKWSLENNDRTLSMTFGESKKEFLVVELTADNLHYRLGKPGAVYHFEWTSK